MGLLHTLPATCTLKSPGLLSMHVQDPVFNFSLHRKGRRKVGREGGREGKE